MKIRSNSQINFQEQSTEFNSTRNTFYQKQFHHQQNLKMKTTKQSFLNSHSHFHPKTKEITNDNQNCHSNSSINNLSQNRHVSNINQQIGLEQGGNQMLKINDYLNNLSQQVFRKSTQNPIDRQAHYTNYSKAKNIQAPRSSSNFWHKVEYSNQEENPIENSHFPLAFNQSMNSKCNQNRQEFKQGYKQKEQITSKFSSELRVYDNLCTSHVKNRSSTGNRQQKTLFSISRPLTQNSNYQQITNINQEEKLKDKTISNPSARSNINKLIQNRSTYDQFKSQQQSQLYKTSNFTKSKQLINQVNGNNYIEKLNLDIDQESKESNFNKFNQFKIKSLKNIDQDNISTENKSRKDYFQIKKNYHQMDEGLTLDSGIIKKNKFYLVIQAYNLNEVKNKNNLRYFYFDKQPMAQKLFQKDIISDFTIFKEKIIEKFNFNVPQIFVFLKCGKQVYSFLEIPEDDQTIIVSTKPLFTGIYNLCYNKVKQQNLIQVINQLERPIGQLIVKNKNHKNVKYQTIEEKTREHYEDIMNDIIQLFEKKQLNKDKRLQFNNVDEYMDKENLEKYLIETDQQKDIQEINEHYEKQLKKKQNVDNAVDQETQSKCFNKIENYLFQLLELNEKENQNKQSSFKANKKVDKIVSSENIDDQLLLKHDEDGKMIVNIKEEIKNQHISKNMNSIMSKKSVALELGRQNKEVFTKNIPMYMKKYHFSREQIHECYILYKTLHLVTSMRYHCGKYQMEKGLDYHTFKNGIYQVGVQAEEIVRRQFQTVDQENCGYLDWEQFLKLMVSLQAKTLENKINLFFQTADVNKDGRLSEDEIFDLCKICLSKYLPDDKFLDNICVFYTRLIFRTVDVDIDDEIPLQVIKETILDNNTVSKDDQQLLVMFCGADV